MPRNQRPDVGLMNRAHSLVRDAHPRVVPSHSVAEQLRAPWPDVLRALICLAEDGLVHRVGTSSSFVWRHVGEEVGDAPTAVTTAPTASEHRVAWVVRLLRQTGRPMSRSEILERTVLVDGIPRGLDGAGVDDWRAIRPALLEHENVLAEGEGRARTYRYVDDVPTRPIEEVAVDPPSAPSGTFPRVADLRLKVDAWLERRSKTIQWAIGEGDLEDLIRILEGRDA